MSQIIDLLDKLHERKIQENTVKNERYIIRNELVKCLNLICSYNLENHDLMNVKNSIVDGIIKLNIEMTKGAQNENPEDTPNY